MKTKMAIEQRLKELTDPRDIELLTWVLEDDNTLMDFVRQAIEKYPHSPIDQVRHLRYSWEAHSKQFLGGKEAFDLIRNYQGGN